MVSHWSCYQCFYCRGNCRITILLYARHRNASLVKARTYITDTSEKARSTVSGNADVDDNVGGIWR